MSDIASKLRAEIQESKKMRHDFVLRKFSFITILLGLGSLASKIPMDATIDFAWLLFLVPIVAIAFDFYILTEDFRIKRAGEFLKSDIKSVDEDEKEWEEYSKNNQNIASTFAFSFVTLIYLLGAATLLFQSNNETINAYFWWWVVFVELALIYSSVMLRSWLKPRHNHSYAE